MTSGMPCGRRFCWPAASVVVGALLLAGCAEDDPAPIAAPPSTTVRATTPSTTPSATTAAPVPVPGMPVPVSTGPSTVDSSRIRSLDDLPAAFECPSAVAPIRIPAPTGAEPIPDSLICPSRIAKGEAIYLWFFATPMEKRDALTAALARAKYVHAGANWVAAGSVNPDLGSVGGEVYR